MSTIFAAIKVVFSSAIAAFPSLRRANAERKAGLNPDSARADRADDLLDGALGRLGAISADASLLLKMSNAIGGMLVRPEHFSKPYIREWISHPDANAALKRMAKARIASAPESEADRTTLISLHVKMSGEHGSYAESSLSYALSFLTASVQWAAKDPGNAAILQAGLETLHDRLDNIIAISAPLNWTFDLAKQANRQWLIDVFSSKRQAKLHLRQPISPGDATQGKPASRAALVAAMTPLLTHRSDGKIAALIGDEGNGKSWLVAHSWLSLQEKPFMVFFTADDLSAVVDPASEIRKILINKLITQTKESPSDSFYNWWSSELRQWRSDKTADILRLVVVIDGLNQRPKTDWSLIIEVMNSELEMIGGRLLITARAPFYATRVKPRLISQINEVNVPEWTDAERDAIFAIRGVPRIDLRPKVAASLRNPRLLGIALHLLQSEQIQELEELSISRLLFEHMRMHEQEAPSPRPAHEFARTLQEHAQIIFDRVKSARYDDLKIFDGGLEAASDGRFFIPVTGDSTRYKIDDDGLTLALGFAVLDKLHIAHRNGRDIDHALEAMIDPISALDQTAGAIIAAITIASFSENCPPEICSAIIVAFAELQNPDSDEFPSFATLAHKCPEAFMFAARRLALATARPSNIDWVVDALVLAKNNGAAWFAMAPILKSWLEYYSLSPEIQMFSQRSDAEEYNNERTNKQNELNKKLDALSDSESELLKKSTLSNDSKLDTLGHITLKLIAGKPLTPFATAFTHWSFANALNGSFHAPNDDFKHLIRLNRIDWRSTRDAILEECGIFEKADVSDTGKWAFVNMLSATGHPDDAIRAQVLADELTINREKSGNWRNIENYCTADPCDPGNAMPQNVTKTAEKYALIDVSKIRIGMGYSSEDYFLDNARPAIARFYPSVAIEKHRELIDEIFERNDAPLRYGIFEVLNHNSLATAHHATAFAERVKTGNVVKACNNLDEKDHLFISQYHLLAAFPFLSANEQVNSISSKHAHENFFLELLNLGKALNEKEFESLLNTSIQGEDERLQFIFLGFAAGTKTPLTEVARGHVIALTKSQSDRVRTQALGLIFNLRDKQAIGAVVKSGWTAFAITRNNHCEMWNGSCVILAACELGIISHSEALARITPGLYGQAAKKLGINAARDVAKLIDASIKRAVGLTFNNTTLDVEIASMNDDTQQFRYHLSEKARPPRNPIDIFLMQTESDEAFNKREHHLQLAFEALEAEVSNSQAEIFLERFQMREFDAIVDASQDLAEGWFELFIKLPPHHRGTIRNIGLWLAHGLMKSNPDQAIRLFKNLKHSDSFLHITYGSTSLQLDAMTLWSANEHPSIKDLRFERLEIAANDDELAQEALVALWNGKQNLLREYIETQLNTREPANIARALMVAGFSDCTEFNDEILANHKDARGFIGEAQSAAMYAYERNVWSKHWFTLMRQTQKADDFWRYSVLLTKIVDGRFDIWNAGTTDIGEPYSMFWPSVERQLKQRCEKWRGKRKKNLFGNAAPSKIFLSRD